MAITDDNETWWDWWQDTALVWTYPAYLPDGSVPAIVGDGVERGVQSVGDAVDEVREHSPTVDGALDALGELPGLAKGAMVLAGLYFVARIAGK